MHARAGSNKFAVMPLTARQSDLEWLTRLSQGDRDVPPFNISRLIALGFLEKSDSSVHVTERGIEVLASAKKKAEVRGRSPN